ncbi:hypothetical protein [Cohnella hashimotonis]|uniref:Secreted protein n=1 Tax=Cohnella hashimotonis TaxID=2826895 RepID=A0ABT6TN28_9BACL|nr:hypothetical protein [Cohnella hashimotonis]MDI4647319.1 hypothetical protein [Cohnella hashimotonis]
MKSIISFCFLFLLVAATASAAGHVGGTSGGGTQGVTDAWGDLSLSQGGFFDNDRASGSTGSNGAGDLGVGVFLHYATSGSGDNVVDSYNFATGHSVSTSVSGPNDTGTYVNGGHTYSSTQYGSWSGGTNLTF